MLPNNIKLDKEFGVLVHVGDKTLLRQFDYEDEAYAYGLQLSAHETVEYEILKRPKMGVAGRPYSPAFVDVPAPNMPGGIVYKCIPVRPLKGHLFCTNCHDYRKFKVQVDEYGLDLNCCTHCGLADSDYYIKTANNLWPKATKEK